jgi:hypothetical protein
MSVVPLYAVYSYLRGGNMRTRRTIFLIVLLMMAMTTGWSQGLSEKRPEFKGMSPPTGLVTSLGLEISTPVPPRIGEVFEVTLILECKGNLEGPKFGPDYTVIFSSNGAEVISGERHSFSGYMRAGETRQFHASMVIKEPFDALIISGSVASSGWPPQTIGLELFLVDKERGQYGSKENYGVRIQKASPEWYYDPLQDILYPYDDKVDMYTLQKNVEWLDEVEEIQAGLTKWEKLYLLHDVLHYPVRGTVIMTDLEAAHEFLNAGWLEAYRAGQDAREKWLEDFLRH